MTTPTTLKLPREFRPITPKGEGRLFLDYLVRSRHYTQEHAERICLRYDLHFAMQGSFAYRIVLPVYDRTDRLVTWTGRTISDDQELRYRTLSTKPDDRDPKAPVALGPITDYLFNEAKLEDGGDLLLVCEGLFDAVRLDFAGSYFENRKVRATCLFGKAVHDRQIDTLADLAPRYSRKLLVLDADAAMDSFRVVNRLQPFGFRAATIPERFKDPDQMSISAAQRFMMRELEKINRKEITY